MCKKERRKVTLPLITGKSDKERLSESIKTRIKT